MKKKALFVVSEQALATSKTKLLGLDYEAKLSEDGKTAYVVVRDCNRYVGDPIAYASQILKQSGVKACC